MVAKAWGCRGTKAKYYFTVEDDDGNEEKIWRCPYAILKNTDVWQVMKYFRLYRQGFLPTAGGVLDQPMKLMEALDFLSLVLPDYQEEAKKREKAGEKFQEKLKAKSNSGRAN